MLQTDTLVLGGGYAALGCACARPDSLLLVEHEALGDDYAGLLRPAGPGEAPATEEGEELRAFFRANHALDGAGRVDVLRASTAVCRFARDRGVRALLDAALVEVRPDEGGFLVTCVTANGLREIRAARLLDTTARRISCRPAARLVENRLHLVCSGPSDAAPQLTNASVQPGAVPREWFVTFSFSPETELPAARLDVQTRWQQAFPAGEYHIDAMGADFDPVALESGTPGICAWLAPHGARDPIGAFERGVQWAKEGRA